MAFFPMERYWIAHDALMVLTFVPSLILFLCSLCAARRRGDPARRAFSWLKAAFGFFTLFIFLDFAGYGLDLAASRISHDTNLDSAINNVQNVILQIEHAANQVFAIARLIEIFTDLMTFLMLVNLGNGILISHAGKQSESGKIVKHAALGISAVLAILAIAFFGLRTNYIANIFRGVVYGLSPKMANQFNTSRQLDFSVRVLLFILSLGIVAQSVAIKMKTRTEPRVHTACNMFVACAVLWLLRSTYSMAAMASLTNLSSYLKDPTFKNYFDITDVVLGTWPELILLSLAFGLGSKKANGLWSTEQPFMTRGGNAVSPWGFNYDPNQVSQPVMVHGQPPVAQQNWPQYQQPQPYYAPQAVNEMPHNGINEMPTQSQPTAMPHYTPQQQTPYNVYMPQPQVRSPPPHEDAMGLNHQANGSPPQAVPQPYYEKA
ncbi:hypothetical protein BGZ63DRAFT_421860 [Mariannaea sp. PMI_226]|nr:hypothetical protein BGZ63DRAFT_421860 [Mariannaea sp. PMI_226]